MGLYLFQPTYHNSRSTCFKNFLVVFSVFLKPGGIFVKNASFFLPPLSEIHFFVPAQVFAQFISNCISHTVEQGLGSRSRVFLAPWSRSRSRFLAPWSRSRSRKNYQEPEPLEKKTRAGAAKNQPAPQPCSVTLCYFLPNLLNFPIIFFSVFIELKCTKTENETRRRIMSLNYSKQLSFFLILNRSNKFPFQRLYNL